MLTVTLFATWTGAYSVTTSRNPGGSAEIHGATDCRLTVARGLSYAATPVPAVAPIVLQEHLVSVARAERESLVIVAPNDSQAGHDGTLTVNAAGVFGIEVFRLIAVPGVEDQRFFDVLAPVTDFGYESADRFEQNVFLASFGVPVSTAPGDYPVSFSLGDCSATAVLRVFDVSIALDQANIIQATLDPEKRAGAIQHQGRSSPLIREALQYGINAFAGIYPRLSAHSTKSDAGQAILAGIRDLLASDDVRSFRLPMSQYHRGSTYADRLGRSTNSAEIVNRLDEEMEPYREILNDAASRKKLVIKLWDEPVPDNYAEIVTLYTSVREVLPDIPLELAEQPDPRLDDVADIWTVYIDYLLEEAVRVEHDKGKRMLLYANKMHAIHNDSDTMRKIGWILWRFDLDGYHFWRLNWWNRDPWTTRSSWAADFDKTGTFVYPVGDAEAFSSIRLLSFREGMEDAALLNQLEACASDATAVSWISSLKSRIISDSNDPLLFNMYRERAKLLQFLKSCP